MADLNEKIISEFLELMKRVGAIEQNQQDIKNVNTTVVEQSTKMIQGFQDQLSASLNKQNSLVQNTNDSLARQVNDAMAKITQRANGVIDEQSKKIPSREEFDKLIESVQEMERTTARITKSINSFNQAISYIKNIEEKKAAESPYQDLSIDELNITRRCANCLRAESIKTVGQLAKMTYWDLLKIPNMGRRSVKELQDTLAKLGIIIEKGRPHGN